MKMKKNTRENRRAREKARVIGGILAGIAIGSIGALLLAPKSGKEARRQLVKESRKFKDDVSNDLTNAVRSLTKKSGTLISKENQTA